MGHEDVQYLRRVLSSTTLLTAADAPTTDFDLPTEVLAAGGLSLNVSCRVSDRGHSSDGPHPRLAGED